MASKGRQITIEFLGNSRDLQNAANDGARSTSKLGDTLKKVGKAAAIGLGVGAVAAGAAMFDMAKAAIADEAAASKLAQTLKNTTGATSKQIAGVEEWISAQGKALGVTDDELRPAIENLARATGDVGEAQKLASLAMNVSAGTGKSLEAVSTALMKAQNGQVSSLSRLGIKTKNAKGETISFEQATKKMAETFGGQAATKANTLQGRIDRLKLMFDETKEAIGARLLPIVERLVGWITDSALPAFQRFSGWVQSNVIPVVKDLAAQAQAKLQPIMERVGEFIRTKLVPIFVQVGDIIRTKVIPLVLRLAEFWATKLAPAILEIYANVATKLRPIFDQLVDTFRTQVLPTVKKLLDKFEEWRPTIQKVILVVAKIIGKVLEFGAVILAKVLPPAVRFAGWLIATLVPAVIKGIEIVAKIIGKVIDFGKKIFEAGQKAAEFAGKVKEKIGEALDFIKEIPTKVKNALTGAGTWLLQTGKNIIGGLIQGIRDMAGDLINAIRESVTDKIPGFIKDRLGIHSPSVVLTKIGHNIMDGLIGGIKSKSTALTAALERITGYITGQVDKLKGLISSRDDFAAGFQSFTSSVFGADFSDPETGKNNSSVEAMIAYQEQQKKKARQLATDVRKLIKLGLSPALIRQLQESGDAGITQIHALAQGDASDIKELNALNASTTAALNAAGMAAGNELYGDKIRETRADVATAKAIRNELEKLLKQQDKNTIVVLKLGAHQIRASLLELKRTSASGNLGLA